MSRSNKLTDDFFKIYEEHGFYSRGEYLDSLVDALITYLENYGEY